MGAPVINQPDIYSLLSGPAGGLVGIAYAFGCASGYGFAIRTAYRAVKDRLDRVESQREHDRLAHELERANDHAQCQYEITNLQTHQRELVDMLLGKRQLGFFSTPGPPPAPIAKAVDKLDNINPTE